MKKKSEDKWGVLTKKYLQQAYKINLINRLPSSISDVKVEYLIFCFRDEISGEKRSSGRVTRTKGSINLASLEGNAQKTLQTDPIQLRETKLRQGYIWSGGGSPKSKDRLEGIWIRFYVGNKLVSEHSSPKNLINRETW